MEMNKADDWIISSEEIILDVLLTNGRFADIYKARYHPYNNIAKRNVVAKTLKSNNQYICTVLLIVRYCEIYIAKKEQYLTRETVISIKHFIIT